MGRVHGTAWALVLSLFAVPALAACRPEAWMCSSPMRQTAPTPVTQLNEEGRTLIQAGHLALQRDDSDPNHSDIRPVIKFNENSHMSVKLGRHHGEIKWKLNF